MATLQRPDGTTLVYVRRRFISPPEHFALLQEHVVVEGERLDNLAAAYLGDPEQFWRLCDANAVLAPEELETPGRVDAHHAAGWDAGRGRKLATC